MEINRQKCSVLRVSQYQLKGTVLTEEHTTKYHGVDLQSSLSWRNHISCVTKKANKMLVFLWPKLKQASEETKAKAYFTMVRSNLDYCRTIWSPFQQDSKHQAEMVQRRAARFCNKKIQKYKQCHRPAQQPRMEGT